MPPSASLNIMFRQHENSFQHIACDLLCSISPSVRLPFFYNIWIFPLLTPTGARKRMGRPRTVNRQDSDRSSCSTRQSTVLPLTPPAEYDSEWSPPLDLGELEFDWLMSPSTSCSNSAAESPMMMPLPTFLDLTPNLWGEQTDFPMASSPLYSATGESSANNKLAAAVFSAPDTLTAAPQSQSSTGLGIQAPTPAKIEPVAVACFCDSTPVIESLRSTLRSAIQADDALRAAFRTTGMCTSSRHCGVCEADPSTPVAAFTVLSLSAQILAGALAEVLTMALVERSSTQSVTDVSMGPAAVTGDATEETIDPGTIDPAVNAGVQPSSPSTSSAPAVALPVCVGSFTLPTDIARRVLLVALLEEVRGLRSAAAKLELGAMFEPLGRQLRDLETRMTATLDERR